MTIWEVPSPVVGSAHKLKYSLFYGANGKRLLGYDNERGKARIGFDWSGRWKRKYRWGARNLVESWCCEFWLALRAIFVRKALPHQPTPANAAVGSGHASSAVAAFASPPVICFKR